MKAFYFTSFFILSCSLLLNAEEFSVESNVVYGEVDGQKLLVDIGTPKAPAIAPRPALILVHGGGWVEGSKEAVRWATEGLAREGYVSFGINYRLMKDGKNTWPAQIDDVQRAVRWIRANAAKYGVDPNRIGAFGGSAGGHLVSLLGTMDTRDNSDKALATYSSRVQCVVDMNGPADLSKGFAQTSGGQGNGWVNSLITNLMGGTPTEKPTVYQEASPITHVDAKSAPFLIFHGKVDDIVPVAQSEWLHAALQKAGVESTLVLFEGEGHDFKQQANQDRFVEEFRKFIAKHLR